MLSAVTSVDRRRFLKIVTQAVASIGLTSTASAAVLDGVSKGRKPPIIWLHFQECTGCTESLLRTSHPGIAEFILDLVSLEYHETLMAAAGRQAEAALDEAVRRNSGKYVLVIEGALPRAENGNYLKIAGATGLEIARSVADTAGAIIALGSCASWGGISSADPNPTHASPAQDVLRDKRIINLPGCPPNPYILLGVAMQYATLGKLPELDEKQRPKFAYGRTIHEHCPRRPHFDAGRFANEFGDEGHRLGYCLYKLGCKGPATHASCSVQHFCEVVDAWPIGLGHPCIGCTEQSLAFRVPLFQTIPIERPAPPDTYAPVAAQQGHVAPIATGVAGLIAGGIAVGSWIAAKELPKQVGEPGGSTDGGEE